MPSPCPVSGRSRRPSRCSLSRRLLSTSACSRSKRSRMRSSIPSTGVVNLDQLRSHPPRHYRRRTSSLSRPQLPCPNSSVELHLPSRLRSQVNRHVRTHFLHLPTCTLRPNALLLPFPRSVRLRAALQRPARPRIPSHSVARSITRDTRRLTRRVDRSAGRRPHQLRLRLSNLRVLVRPRNSQ